MKYKIITIIIVFANFYFIAHANQNAIVDSANNYYSNNQFEKAIANYESIIDSGYEATEIYFNLGNSYYKTHNIAKAILNYERSLLLSPNDEDIQFNLKLANTYIVDKLEEIPPFFLKVWINNFAMIISSNNWAIISMVSFILFLILLLVYLFNKSIIIKKTSFWICVCLLASTIISFSLSNKNKNLLLHQNSAIVMQPSLTAKSTPDNSGTDLFIIHEGSKVVVEDELGDWCEIKLSDGNKGWIRKNAVEKISIINNI